MGMFWGFFPVLLWPFSLYTHFPQFTRIFHLLQSHATAAAVEIIGIIYPSNSQNNQCLLESPAVTPGDFCSKQPETFERDIISIGVSVHGWKLQQCIKLGILVRKKRKKDRFVFNLSWIIIPTLCAMTENSVLNSKVDSVKQIVAPLMNTCFLPCMYQELILISVI